MVTDMIIPKNIMPKSSKKFSNQGVKAKAMLPSFPTITFPNHWSIITGLYPSSSRFGR